MEDNRSHHLIIDDGWADDPPESWEPPPVLPPQPPEPPRRPGPGSPPRPERAEPPAAMPVLVALLMAALLVVQLLAMGAGARGGYPAVIALSLAMAALFLGPFVLGSFWLKAKMAEARRLPHQLGPDPRARALRRYRRTFPRRPGALPRPPRRIP